MALRRVRAGFSEASALLRRRPRPDGGIDDRELARLAERIEAALDRRLSGVAIRNRAAEVAAIVATLDPDGLRRFFRLLLESFGPSLDVLGDRLGQVAEALATGPAPAATPGADGVAATSTRTAAPAEGAPGASAGASTRRVSAEQLRAVEALRQAAVPGWERLFELLCGLAGGVKLTVDLRADLLELARDEPELGALDVDLRRVLDRLFPAGLLELRRITWDSAGSLLEKLIEYEAVHAITSWDDLKNRLDDHDRRCYAFIHPGMPDEPLIFVEVALLDDIAGDVVTLLDVTAPKGAGHDATTAIFYSISACQPGLAGVNLGDVLIKEVVADLVRDLPRLEQFATLSPIPGFRRWLDRALATGDGSMLTTDDLKRIADLTPDGATGPQALAALLTSTCEGGARPDQRLRPLLTGLCIEYLLGDGTGRARDRVANFHLTNGAQVERLNWMANPTPVGIRESYGLMVNYRYDLSRIDANHEQYVAHAQIARSSGIGRMATARRKARAARAKAH